MNETANEKVMRKFMYLYEQRNMWAILHKKHI